LQKLKSIAKPARIIDRLQTKNVPGSRRQKSGGMFSGSQRRQKEIIIAADHKHRREGK